MLSLFGIFVLLQPSPTATTGDVFRSTAAHRTLGRPGQAGGDGPLPGSLCSDGFSPNDTMKTEIRQNQHESVVLMGEEPAVWASASHLYNRSPSVSALLVYRKESVRLLRGRRALPVGQKKVVLVAHGAAVRLAARHSEELYKLVATLKSENILDGLTTFTLVSCMLGSDRGLMLQLLHFLRALGVEPELLLYDSALSVTSDGLILTRRDGVWRSHDLSRRVIAQLDERGDLLTRAELGCAGPAFPGYRGPALYLQTFDWPSQPRMFVPKELRKKYPSIACLEGLTWSLFYEENERRRAPDYLPDQRHTKAVWLVRPETAEEGNIVFKHIGNIQDLLVEIRYNAREEVASDLFYVLNDCIYKVHGWNLTVSLVGKFLSAGVAAETDRFRLSFEAQQGQASLQELRRGLKASKFNDFCRQTFQFQLCSFNCERWGRYFMSAVFAASVRNFRTFSLFLMSVIGCEVGRSRGADGPLCTAFVGDDHPMLTEEPWPGRPRRGFYGCTVENFQRAPADRQAWLDQVVAKENALYVRSKQMMNAVSHDEQTELEIFGKVKVMNKYVFSSYLEFFRGTDEGKKLKRGCAPAFKNNLDP